MTRSPSGPKLLCPKILIAHGINLDLLGSREPEHYGSQTLEQINATLRARGPQLAKQIGFDGCDLHFFQSNDESAYLTELSKSWDGAVMNPGAWTHTSLALADRLIALKLKFVEVHLSNVAAREPIRQRSLVSQHALGIVSGLAEDSYEVGLFALLRTLAA